MTREVAIDNLKADIKYWENTSVSTEHLYMAIKALENEPRFLVHSDGKIEQIIEPCGDAVSRQAVNDLYDRYHPRLATHVYEFGEELKALPSVTPKREQGEWIEKVHNFEKCWAECSVCGKTASGHSKDTGWGYTYSYTDYCPNCGAEMR